MSQNYLNATQSKSLRDTRNSIQGPALRQSVINAQQRPDGGRYDVSFKQTKERPKSAYIGGKKDRFATSKTAVPGPGSYKSNWNASTKVQDPRYSVSKSERKSKFDLPKSSGPDQGTYVHATTFEKNKNKAHEFGKPYKTQYNNNPSPDKYRINNSPTKERIPSATIGTQPRPNIWKKEIEGAKDKPECGTYERTTTFESNKKKAYTFGAAYETKYNANPGPGQYSESHNLTKTRSVNGATQKKEARKDIFADEIRRAEQTPDAGKYNVKNTKKVKVQEFGKPYKHTYDNNPMAHKYQPDQTANFMQSNIKINKAERTDIWKESLEKAASVPEANYRHVDTFEANKKKAHEFGKPYKHTYNANPSPDKYQPDVTKNLMATSGNQKISHEPRRDIWEKEVAHAKATPEANYARKDTFEQNKNKASEFGKPYKHTYNQNPSPDRYQPDVTKNLLTTSSNQKISREARQDIWKESLAKAASVPEANYRHIDTFEANKNKASEFGKPYKHTYNQNPSPDKYMPDQSKSSLNKASHPRIGTEARPDIWAKEVAHAKATPEVYSQKDTFELNKKNAAMIGLPRKEEKNSNPGVGQYEPMMANSFNNSLNGKSTMQAWSKDARRDPFEEDIKRASEMPSNLYAQEQQTISATKKSFTIGTAFTHKYNENPGPGQYQHSESPQKGVARPQAGRDTMEFFRQSF